MTPCKAGMPSLGCNIYTENQKQLMSPAGKIPGSRKQEGARVAPLAVTPRDPIGESLEIGALWI